MKTIGLVGCGKSKLTRPAPAKDLYTGNLFRLARAYAEKTCDGWGILSAKHNFVLPDEVLKPYDFTMKQIDKDHRQQWIWRTQSLLFQKLPWETYRTKDGYLKIRGIRFVFLAGGAYEIAVEKNGYTVTFPLWGMGLGNRIQWLGRQLKKPQAAQATLF